MHFYVQYRYLVRFSHLRHDGPSAEGLVKRKRPDGQSSSGRVKQKRPDGQPSSGRVLTADARGERASALRRRTETARPQNPGK